MDADSFNKRPVRGRSRTSSLTAAVNGVILEESVENQQGSHPGLSFNSLLTGIFSHPIDDEARLETNLESASPHFNECGTLQDAGGYDQYAANGFRAFTTGQPRISYFRVTPPRSPVTRRATISDLPELDHRLMPYREFYQGVEYLELNRHTIALLAPFIQGSKPISDLAVFNNLIIEYKIARNISDTAETVLRGISPYFTGTLLLSGVNEENKTSVEQDCTELLKILKPAKTGFWRK